MKKLTGKQKTTVGFVGAVVAAAMYLFGGIMGWWNNPLAEEPVKEQPKAEAPAQK